MNQNKVIITIDNVTKTYKSGHKALTGITLDIVEGEVLALLGPNGAGKTTLISTICGIISPTTGTILIDGFDNIKQYKKARAKIGLVPQELTLGNFDTVWDTVCLSEGLFNKPHNAQYLNQLLDDLSLSDKKSAQIRELSGGMKRRVLIAKALAHKPPILFLDEPTAGVDVELRKDMWQIIRNLQSTGVTIILTTHYIEEAEEIADRVGVITLGKLLLIKNKNELMQDFGQKKLEIELTENINSIPDELKPYNLIFSDNKQVLIYNYIVQNNGTGITALLQAISEQNIRVKDIKTSQSTLEDIFVQLINEDKK